MQIKEPQSRNVIINKASKVFRAYKHKLRQSMIKFIRENPGTPVTNLFKSLRLEQSVASQHLAVLRNAGLVHTERRGKQIHYFVNEGKIEQLIMVSEMLTGEGE